MTPENQRIAIAEACGWTRPHLKTHPKMWQRPKSGNWQGPFRHKEGKGRWLEVIPDFHNDLNACAEMERHLLMNSRFGDPHSLYAKYASEVARLCAVQKFADYKAEITVFEAFGYAICATAPQRCEAFLRALGLWKDEEGA